MFEIMTKRFGSHNKQIYLFGGLIVLAVLALSCATPDQVAKTTESREQVQPDEHIRLNINEAVYFDFQKQDSVWSGELTIYTLNEMNEKVVGNRYVGAQDSTWDDFDEFVDFLDLYQIPPQHQIEGWAPNSGQLPRRVYSFEVFDGDSSRSYSYQDPIDGIREYWQAQHVLLFSTFIQNDLHWIEMPLE